MNAWRMYAWSLVALMAIVIWMSSCSIAPRLPSLLPAKLSTEAPAGASPAEQAIFYRKLADDATARAAGFEREAKKAKLEARQEWLWWVGVAAIVLGVIAFALAFAYPLVAFLRIGGVASVASGIASLLIGEALPYMGWFLAITVAAIAASLILNRRVITHLTDGFKAASDALPADIRSKLDQAHLARQGKLVKSTITRLLGKK